MKPLGGRPLLQWVVDAARESGVVDRIVVSTDDDEIADVARTAGAEVPFMRPAELATDTASSIDVVSHALETLDAELVLLLQPTEPFVQPAQIRDALALLHEREADSAITVVEVPRNFHPFHVRTNDGWLEFADEEAHYAHPTRQLDPPRWAFANLYWFRAEAFLRERRIECGRRVGLPVDPLTAVDLNTPADWVVAEGLVAAGLV